MFNTTQKRREEKKSLNKILLIDWVEYNCVIYERERQSARFYEVTWSNWHKITTRKQKWNKNNDKFQRQLTCAMRIIQFCFFCHAVGRLSLPACLQLYTQPMFNWSSRFTWCKVIINDFHSFGKQFNVLYRNHKMSRVFQIIYRKKCLSNHNERTNFKLEHRIIYNNKKRDRIERSVHSLLIG